MARHEIMLLIYAVVVIVLVCGLGTYLGWCITDWLARWWAKK